MRVGILTFHRALNYGAVLQAYALQRTVTRLNAEAEIVDYRCESLEKTYKPLFVHEPSLKGVLATLVYLPIRLVRAAKFASFRRRLLKQSGTEYSRDTIGRANDSYDCFIVGSDQVWNPDLTGSDGTYFLDFVDEPRKKNSYAASLGRSSSMPVHAETYRSSLSDFSSISVREQDARDFLETLLGREVSWVLDPVLLAEPSDFQTIAVSPKHRRPYIFSYCLHETDMYRYVEHLRRQTGLEVLYVPESIRTKLSGTRAMFMSPEEFLGCIRDAAYVVTDSYHVVALSIVFRKVFKAQLKSALPELNSRITSLLGQLGLQGQLITPADYEKATPPELDYAQAAEAITAAVTTSGRFLSQVLRDGIEH